MLPSNVQAILPSYVVLGSRLSTSMMDIIVLAQDYCGFPPYSEKWFISRYKTTLDATIEYAKAIKTDSQFLYFANALREGKCEELGMAFFDDVENMIAQKYGKLGFFVDDPHEWPPPLLDSWEKLSSIASAFRRATRDTIDIAGEVAIAQANESASLKSQLRHAISDKKKLRGARSVA